MVFSSVTFLFFFRPAALLTYHVMPRRARNAWLDVLLPIGALLAPVIAAAS